MNIGKALAVTAVAGMVAGMTGCGGDKPPAADPASANTEKKSCSAGGSDPASGGGEKKSCSAGGGEKKSCSAGGTGGTTTPTPPKS